MEDNCYDHKNEKNLEDPLKDISLDQKEYFQKQMKNSICKIKCIKKVMELVFYVLFQIHLD